MPAQMASASVHALARFAMMYEPMSYSSPKSVNAAAIGNRDGCRMGNRRSAGVCRRAGLARQQTMIEAGRRLFFDVRLSEPPGTACASCHDPARAFSGDNGSGLPVPLGSRAGMLGTRNTPTAMYLATSPGPGTSGKGRCKVVPSGGFSGTVAPRRWRIRHSGRCSRRTR